MIEVEVCGTECKETEEMGRRTTTPRRTAPQRPPHRKQAGSALVAVLVLILAVALSAAAVLRLAAHDLGLTRAHSEYKRALAAAESGLGRAFVELRKAILETGVPPQELLDEVLPPTLQGFQFAAPNDTPAFDIVAEGDELGNTAIGSGRWGGLTGDVQTYRLRAGVVDGKGSGVVLKQTVQITKVPVSRFAALYGDDLEVFPGAYELSLGGPVHTNGDLYVGAEGAFDLYFRDLVRSAGEILRATKHSAAYPTGSVEIEDRYDVLRGMTYEGSYLDHTHADWPTRSYHIWKGTTLDSAHSVPPLQLLLPPSASAHDIVERAEPDDHPVVAAQKFENKADLVVWRNGAGLVQASLDDGTPFSLEYDHPEAEIPEDTSPQEASYTTSLPEPNIIAFESGEEKLGDNKLVQSDTFVIPVGNSTLEVSVTNRAGGYDAESDLSGGAQVVDALGFRSQVISVVALPDPEDLIGVLGGHIDVDTSSFIADIGDGRTDGHVHQYDNKYDTPEVDLFHMLDFQLHNITADIPDGSTKFKLIVANASLSPGGILTINSEPNPVAAYDDTELADLPVYSFDGVAGTTQLTGLKMVFDILAIARHTVLPTNTGDVRGNVPGKNGEWRNGALTLQAVAVNEDGSDAFTTDTSLSAGGNQGVATSGLLYECTIFWHWDGPSYHEPGWDTYDPSAPEATGTLGINCNWETGDLAFGLDTVSEGTVTVATLKADLNYTYMGIATELRITPLAGPNVITLNGQEYELDTATRYTITSDCMEVDLTCKDSDKEIWGQCKDKWEIRITANGYTIVPDPSAPEGEGGEGEPPPPQATSGYSVYAGGNIELQSGTIDVGGGEIIADGDLLKIENGGTVTAGTAMARQTIDIVDGQIQGDANAPDIVGGPISGATITAAPPVADMPGIECSDLLALAQENAEVYTGNQEISTDTEPVSGVMYVQDGDVKFTAAVTFTGCLIVENGNIIWEEDGNQVQVQDYPAFVTLQHGNITFKKNINSRGRVYCETGNVEMFGGGVLYGRVHCKGTFTVNGLVRHLGSDIVLGGVNFYTIRVTSYINTNPLESTSFNFGEGACVVWQEGAGDGGDSVCGVMRDTQWAVRRVATVAPFADWREGDGAAKVMHSLDVDVSLLAAHPDLPGPIVYAYNAFQPGDSGSAARLHYGGSIPTGGLTFASPNPVYIRGAFNTTEPTQPALVCGDAVSVQSDAWTEETSWEPLAGRAAADTVVRGTIMTGGTESAGEYYSGGLENAVRLCEDWAGKTFMFHGSLVCLWQSEIATGLFAAGDNRCNPPLGAALQYDAAHLNPTFVPPGCPKVVAFESMRFSQDSWRQDELIDDNTN